MKKLQGQVAIVTGAGSGMGRAIAKLYAKEGAKVVVSDINQETAELVAKEIESDHGEALVVVGNVSKQVDVDAMVEKTLQRFGTIDIVVNNAGIMDNFMPIEKVNDEMWDRVFGVNVTGPMRILRKVMPIFLEKKAGVIVNIASAGGLNGSRAGVAYTASKHAVIGLTKNIAFQYALSGVRCNAIAPGGVNTNIGNMIKHPDEFGMARAMAGIGLNPRAGEPEEIAAVALFLASSDASFVNGAVIVADAGWTAY